MQIQPGTGNARQSAEIGRKAQPKARSLSKIPAASGMDNLEISVADDDTDVVLIIRRGGKVWKVALTEVT